MANNIMSDFANTKEDAIVQYLEYYTKDPFPQISPALLNSADIQAYVAKTGMIFPFHEEDLKPASYALRLLGDYIYWDKDGKTKIGSIKEGDIFELENDSIAFVSLEPLFHLPYYIAARFNLKIDNVYKGLLLGTGPLVDPGFIGYLSFPLHNLTSNKYTFIGGEVIAWMEFTKLSENKNWVKTDNKNKYDYAKNLRYKDHIEMYSRSKNDFSKIKYDRVNTFLSTSAKQSVRSTIPLTIKANEKAMKVSEKTIKQANVFQWVVLISIIFTIVYTIFQIHDLITDNNIYVNGISTQLKTYQEKVNLLENKIDSLESEIKNLNSYKGTKINAN